MKYEIEVLSSKRLVKKRDKLLPLLRPGYVSLDHKMDLLDPKNEDLLILAAFENKIPVGLAVVYKRPALKLLELFSFHATHANVRIGLIAKLKEESIKENYSIIHALYPEREPFLSEWEKTFIQSNWEGKRLAVLECFFEDSNLFHPPWFEKEIALPPKFTSFPWDSLTEADRLKIANNNQQKKIPEFVYPLNSDETFEPLNSLGLRYEGDVVGWVITKRLDEKTIWYSSIYIEHRFQKNGAIISLLAEAVRLQQKLSIKQAIFRVNIIQLPTIHWLRFVKKRLIPFASQVTRYMLAWNLNNNK